MLRWLAIFGLLWFLYLVREVFPPFIVGGILAYLLLPLVRFVSTTCKMPRHFAVAGIYLAFLGTMILLSRLFGGLLIDQAATLFEDRHAIVTKLLEQLSTTFNWQMDVQTISSDIVINLETWLGKPEELVHLTEILSKSLLHVLVSVVSSIYLIMDSESVGRFLLRFVPEERRLAVVTLSSQINVMVAKYIRTQLFLILLMSTVAYVILHFAFQIKYALLIAIFSGVLEIVPVLGPLLAISMAVIVGVAQKGVHVGLLIALCYWIARLTEDYVVIPKFVGHVIELHPLAIIFAVICGEVLAGALGMLIAIPVAAAVKLILDFCYPPPPQDHSQQVHVDSNMFKPPDGKNPEEVIAEIREQLADSAAEDDKNGSGPKVNFDPDSVTS
ncbi:AI-2E family transporter [Candidatus Obscuribacterales bacterium]|nr:AI-2E family transporter [Candidatus Obscuribacterales bacterium]